MLLQLTRSSMQRWLMLYRGANIYCYFADFKKKFAATSARRPKVLKSTVTDDERTFLSVLLGI